MTPSQRDIVLIPIPFTDLTSNRRRPAIVLSNDAYNTSTSDMVVVAMTSNPINVPFSFWIEQKVLEQGKLNRPGKVRTDKIYTLSQLLIAKIFGRVAKTVLDKIRESHMDLMSSP
jgi:mRNA interferase MazF